MSVPIIIGNAREQITNRTGSSAPGASLPTLSAIPSTQYPVFDSMPSAPPLMDIMSIPSTAPSAPVFDVLPSAPLHAPIHTLLSTPPCLVPSTLPIASAPPRPAPSTLLIASAPMQLDSGESETPDTPPPPYSEF